MGLTAATGASLPGLAVADAGDLTVGVDLQGGLPAHVGAAAQAELGANDWIALFVRPELNISLPEADRLGLQLHGGTLLLLDVLTWVPYAGVAGGFTADHSTLQPSLLLLAGVRRFITLRWSIDLSASAGWTPHRTPHGWRATAGIGLRWQPLL